MKAILIFDSGYKYEPNIQVKEFESKEKLIDYINENIEAIEIIEAYEVFGKIEIVPIEKVTKYKIK